MLIVNFESKILPKWAATWASVAAMDIIYYIKILHSPFHSSERKMKRSLLTITAYLFSFYELKRNLCNPLVLTQLHGLNENKSNWYYESSSSQIVLSLTAVPLQLFVYQQCKCNWEKRSTFMWTVKYIFKITGMILSCVLTNLNATYWFCTWGRWLLKGFWRHFSTCLRFSKMQRSIQPASRLI